MRQLSVILNRNSIEGFLGMEFEGDKPVSEAERHLAESRQVTIQPLHLDVTPDDLPADAVAAAHLNGSVVGNVTGDIEQDAPLVQPLAGAIAAGSTKPKGHTGRIVLTVVGLVLFALVIVFVIFQK
jgi:hypothetical protein